MGKVWDFLGGLPQTLIMNFYYFDLRTALHFPILVGRGVKISSLGDRNSIICANPVFGIMRIGLSSGSYDLGRKEVTRWSVQKGGRLKLGTGRVLINRGTGIYIGSGATIEFKGEFFCNANCLLSANRGISFGDDTLIGWNCNIIDGDGHRIIYCDAEPKERIRNIVIDEHVWIGSGSTILKGVNIGKNSVIAMNSHVTKSFGEGQLIIGNKSVRSNITWEH